MRLSIDSTFMYAVASGDYGAGESLLPRDIDLITTAAAALSKRLQECRQIKFVDVFKCRFTSTPQNPKYHIEVVLKCSIDDKTEIRHEVGFLYRPGQDSLPAQIVAKTHSQICQGLSSMGEILKQRGRELRESVILADRLR